MSKRRRIKATQQSRPMVPASAVYYGASGYIATQESPARGRMITFAEDTRRQLSPWARLTLILKSRTLVENYGPAKALWNLAGLIGALKPQAMSGDRAWDELAEKRFNEIAYSPLSFDRAGQFTFSTWQTFTTYRRFVDGDVFSFLTETTSGAAAIAGREAHQCGGGEGDGWIDGVLTDSNGYALRYNFRSLSGGKDYTVLPPQVHHHRTISTMGGTRGAPCLAHAINDMHDALEIKGYVKRAIKTAALMGLTRRADNTGNGSPSNFGLAAAVETDNFSPAGAGYGNTQSGKPVTFEDVFDSGIMSAVPLDVVHDDRPHPNAEEFQKRLMREAAIGLGVPPQILFFMDAPGGAEIRTQLDIFDRFIRDQHANYLLPFCQRFWTYLIAKEMKAGRLPYPSKGDFWKVRWSPPKSITADIGRVGSLTIDLLRAGLTTSAAHYESQGLDYEQELDQVGAEFRRRMDTEEKYGLPPGSLTAALMPPNYSPAAMPPAA